MLIRTFMFAMTFNFTPFLEKILITMRQVFKEFPLSAYPYFVEKIIEKFGDTAEMDDTIAQCFEVFAQISLETMPNVQQFFVDQDMGEDFLGMTYMLCKKKPVILVNSSVYAKTMSLIVEIVRLENMTLAKFALKILRSIFLLVKQGLLNQIALTNFAAENGQKLVNALVEFILDCPTEEILELIDSVLVLIVGLTGQVGQAWLEVKINDIPADCLTLTEKRKFVEVLNENNEEKILKQLVNLSRRAMARMKRMF